jgi:hypothetical protein
MTQPLHPLAAKPLSMVLYRSEIFVMTKNPKNLEFEPVHLKKCARCLRDTWNFLFPEQLLSWSVFVWEIFKRKI